MKKKEDLVNDELDPFRKCLPDLSESCFEKVKVFKECLLRFNSQINLISRHTETHVEIIHLADCALAAQIILNHLNHQDLQKLKTPCDVGGRSGSDQNPRQAPPKTLHDVGSGNGLPGLIFSILDPSLKVFCVEKDKRKAQFIDHAAHKLQLKNVKVIQKRVEELSAKTIECAVSRAFAPLDRALQCLEKPMASGGFYFHIKSAQWTKEAENICSASLEHWAVPRLIKSYSIKSDSAKNDSTKSDGVKDDGEKGDKAEGLAKESFVVLCKKI